MPKFMQAEIPVPKEVVRLNDIFRDSGFEIYAVGGCVRDFLIAQEEGTLFKPKDVDLATGAQPQEIARMLDRAGVRNFEKGESFGVWVAHMNGQDFEVATFRTDGEYKDGRHPEGVVWTTPDEDYKRRDLTINALFYRLPTAHLPGQIIDYGDGVGFDDIKERRVRSVGDPMHRFAEDKLRVLRAVRFHHRFNDDYLSNKAGHELIEAIREFRQLRKHGISGPRIMAEFLACLNHAKSVKKLIFDLAWLGLLDEVFGADVLETNPLLWEDSQLEKFDKTGAQIDPAVVIAWLLRYNNPDHVRKSLNKLNYSNDIVDDVTFLIAVRNLLDMSRETTNRDERLMLAALNMTRNPHRRIQLAEMLVPILEYLGFDSMMCEHLVKHEVKHYDGIEVMKKYNIAQGPELGNFIRYMQTRDYLESLASQG